MNPIYRWLGLRGSWKWACRQMCAGRLVRPADAVGAVRYRISNDGQGRFQWTFERGHRDTVTWENAYYFLGDRVGDWRLAQDDNST